MNKEDYLEGLKIELKKKNKPDDYFERCMKYAEKLLRTDLPVIFDKKHLSLLLGIEIDELNIILHCENLYYSEFNIAKKSGGVRCINNPALILKSIQKWILLNILNKLTVSKYANGFVTKRSILINASAHLDKQCVVNIDIQDFFPSISQKQVFHIFYYYGYTKEISYILAKLCTYKGGLPQGSPASPMLSNLICLKLDKRLMALLEKYDGTYTRYADDITISGNSGIVNTMNKIVEIIEDEGFKVNENKTRIAYKNQRQEITGLIVNSGHVTVQKRYKRDVEKAIYYCKKYGVSEHLQHIKCDKSFYKEHLYGKVLFIHSIEPDYGKELLKELSEIKWDY